MKEVITESLWMAGIILVGISVFSYVFIYFLKKSSKIAEICMKLRENSCLREKVAILVIGLIMIVIGAIFLHIENYEKVLWVVFFLVLGLFLAWRLQKCFTRESLCCTERKEILNKGRYEQMADNCRSEDERVERLIWKSYKSKSCFNYGFFLAFSFLLSFSGGFLFHIVEIISEKINMLKGNIKEQDFISLSLGEANFYIGYITLVLVIMSSFLAIFFSFNQQYGTRINMYLQYFMEKEDKAKFINISEKLYKKENSCEYFLRNILLPVVIGIVLGLVSGYLLLKH
ncbi:hypothetical protein SAMN02745221_02242 [Thermosyntropha lipolytica DSM 11003]|uniref:Uncharacterized protein n=1 Tax=Thermosyntropha lipolytica DSM 11003 TaxID=1123382 RepID=A0A1M5SLU3_9FIRM|nr:hypothetical protein [Thermosyntropha lipolytica]SHH39519.1 hypothetical protein SAMN02745221_02242 [Thermosyntropha lipolytica DSM 11003]